MSNVPKLNRWTTFVKSLGGRVCLDMGWAERAWAEFGDSREGALDVVCHLGPDGDLDVTARPKLEGDNIRAHTRVPQALAALAYVNPASAKDGEPVCRRGHRGDWHQINDGLAVAVAVGGEVGGVDVGGRGAFLVLKGRLWLPFGPQECRDVEDAEVVDATPEEPDTSTGPAADAEAPRADEAARPETRVAPGSESSDAPDTGKVSVLPEARRRKARDRRGRIFGEEAEELIRQSRTRRRRA